MTSARPGLALIASLTTLLLSGCATPIANAYKESRVPSPPHVLAARGIALAEMLVLNPALYYPLEMMGIADFDLVWKNDEPDPLRYDDPTLFSLPMTESGTEASPVFEEPVEESITESSGVDMEDPPPLADGS
jgi:hypothetical protein